MMRFKVLVIGSGPLVKRGVESYLLNLYKFIDHKKISMDFLTPFTCENDKFINETEKYGDSVVEFRIKKNKYLFPLRFYRKLYSYLKHCHYDAVYINTGNVIPMSVAVYAAARGHVKKRIVHSHNGGIYSVKNRILKFISYPVMKKCPTSYLACSKLAAEFIFSPDCAQKTVIVPNGIELERFKLNRSSRELLRQKYNLNEFFVVGHVGAFIEQKNHFFIYDIIKDLQKEDLKVKFVLIGEGPLKEKIYTKVKQSGLDNSVLFIEHTDCVESWMSAFDLFILPSKFEGLPVCAVEAQASGLQCILSDNITREVELTEYVSYLPINKGTKTWIDKVCELSTKVRTEVALSERLKTFDVEESVKIVEKQIFSEDW